MLFRSYLPVIVRILLGTCDCLPCGFFSAGTFISLSVSFHGLKAWTWLLGSSIACRVVMTTCLWGQLARMGLVVILTLPVRFFLQNLEAVDYPSLPCCWSTCQLLNSLQLYTHSSLLQFPSLFYQSSSSVHFPCHQQWLIMLTLRAAKIKKVYFNPS